MSYLMGETNDESLAGIPPDSMDSQPAAHTQLKPRAMGVILSTAACLIISTNLLVASALLRLLLKRSCQRWCFVLNLALTDTLVGVSITGLATEDFNSNHNQLHLDPNDLNNNNNTTPPAARGKTRCLMRMAFVMSPCTASIMSIFLISLDRYAAIKMPLRYSLLSGKGTAVGAVLAVWISSVTLGFSPVLVQQLQSERHYDGYCAFFSVIDEMGIIALFSACFFPVLSLFVYIYLDILKIACSHQRRISRVREASCRTAGDPGTQPYHSHPQHQQLRSFYWSHVKALRTVGVLVGCFLLLWCPFFVVCIVHIVCKSCSLKEVLESYLWLLGLSNSMINPLVYAFWQKEVRLQLAAMFSCFKGRLLATGPPGATGATERCDPQLPVQSQGCISRRETLNPSLLQPISITEAQVVQLSAITDL